MKMISANKLNRLWKNGVVAKMVAKTKVLKTMEEIAANTNAENVAGATTVKELNNNLMSRPNWITDPATGKIIGYKTPGGADTVFPFSELSEDSLAFISPQLQFKALKGQTQKQSYDIYFEKNKRYLFVYYQSSAKSLTVTVSKNGIEETVQMNRDPTVGNISTGIYETAETGQAAVKVSTTFNSEITVYHALLMIFD